MNTTAADLLPTVVTSLTGTQKITPNSWTPTLCAKWRRSAFSAAGGRPFDEDFHPTLRRAAEASEGFVKRMHRNHPRIQQNGMVVKTLILAGRNGCGKTHLARAVYNANSPRGVDAMAKGYWKHSYSCVFVNWSDFMDSEPDGIARDLIEADLAVLDDIGAETDRFKSGQPAARLGHFLSARENKWTFCTTNIKPRDWAGFWDQRVDDRLNRGSKVIDLFDVPSYAKAGSTNLPEE